MEPVNLCHCCLERPSKKDLKATHTRLGMTETYSAMIEECFVIQLSLDNVGEYGICEVCIARLRDAFYFKLQVQRSQATLQERFKRNHVTNEVFSVKLETDDDGTDTVILHVEFPVKSEEADDAASDDAEDGMSHEEFQAKTKEVDDAASDDAEDCISLAWPDAPHASQTCLATSRHGPLASPMKDMPDDAAGLRAEEQACTCDTCGEHFIDKSRLIEHIQAHSTQADKPCVTYSCNICSQEFSCESIYTKHVNAHMNNETYTCDMRIDTGEKPFGCKECNKQFAHKKSLLIHERIHTGEKPYSCKECDKRFRSKSNLDVHTRIHTGKKPYNCKECNKEFTTKQQLNKHKNVYHSEEKPYSCNECDRRFYLKSKLVGHKNLHTRVKPYSCKGCNKQFARKHDLKIHERIHTGEKPFHCRECNKQFTRKDTLKIHERNHTARETM